jgi:hypothetical protein
MKATLMAGRSEFRCCCRASSRPVTGRGLPRGASWSPAGTSSVPLRLEMPLEIVHMDFRA